MGWIPTNFEIPITLMFGIELTNFEITNLVPFVTQVILQHPLVVQ
jgi:hypothetical protein